MNIQPTPVKPREDRPEWRRESARFTPHKNDLGSRYTRNDQPMANKPKKGITNQDNAAKGGNSKDNSSSDEIMHDDYESSIESPRPRNSSDSDVIFASESPEPSDRVLHGKRAHSNDTDESEERLPKRRKVIGENVQSYMKEISHEEFGLRDQIEQLQKDLEKSKSIEAQLNEELSVCKVKLAEHPNLLQNIQTLEEQLAKSKQATQNTKESLEINFKKLEKENGIQATLLAGSIQELEQQLKVKTDAVVKQETAINRLEEKIENSEKTIVELKSQMDADDKRIHGLQEQIKVDGASLKKQEAQLKLIINQIAALLEIISKLKIEKHTLELDLANYKKESTLLTETVQGAGLAILSGAGGVAGSYFPAPVEESAAFLGGYAMDAIDAIGPVAGDTARQLISHAASHLIENAPFYAGTAACIATGAFIFAAHHLYNTNEEIQLDCDEKSDEEMTPCRYGFIKF